MLWASEQPWFAAFLQEFELVARATHVLEGYALVHDAAVTENRVVIFQVAPMAVHTVARPAWQPQRLFVWLVLDAWACPALFCVRVPQRRHHRMPQGILPNPCMM